MNIYTDASYKEGVAGVGIIGRYSVYKKIKAPCSLAAEIIAIIEALKQCKEGDIIRSDCTVAISVVRNKKVVKRLEKLCINAQTYYNKHKGVGIKWVKRVKNTSADHLARRGRKL